MKGEEQAAGITPNKAPERSPERTGEKASGSQPADKLRYLSEITVFQDLSPREMEELNRITTMSIVPRGRVFYRPEEPGEVLFILKEGRVQLYRISPEGKKLVITTLGPHTLFGEMALLGHQDAQHLCRGGGGLPDLRDEPHRPGTADSQQAAGRAAHPGDHRPPSARGRRTAENMAFKGIPARLASLLLRLAEEQGSNDITGLTHQDLAESVGTYRETATQVLNDLKAEG